MSTVFSEQPDTPDLTGDMGAGDMSAGNLGGGDAGDMDLEERHALRRVAGLSTELQDISEVEYRALRLERVVLVGVWAEGSLASAENSLRELSRLAETAGSEVLDALIQRRGRIDAATYIGSGKARELADIVAAAGADTVICDGELTPSQLRRLEGVVHVKVIDRTALILDIFAQHAQQPRGQGPGRGRPSARHAAPAARLGRVAVPPGRRLGGPRRRDRDPRSGRDPSWKPTGGGCGPGSAGCGRTSPGCRPAGRSSAVAGPAVTCRPWSSPATPTRASRACSMRSPALGARSRTRCTAISAPALSSDS